MINLIRRSVFTGNWHQMPLPITLEKLRQWEQLCMSGGKRPLIQDFFPELDDDQREFLLTGTTPTEWDEYVKDIDDRIEAKR